jgi:hypothetical protein
MDELVERANTWLASERERKERARDVGRSWLALLVAGDSDKVAAFIIDLADGSGSLEYDVITELQKNATAYTEQVTRAAFNHIIRRRSNQGCSCGCDACEEEGGSAPGRSHGCADGERAA